MEHKQVTYSELVHYVKNSRFVVTGWLVVCWVVEYQGFVSKIDVENIRRLYQDGFLYE